MYVLTVGLVDNILCVCEKVGSHLEIVYLL